MDEKETKKDKQKIKKRLKEKPHIRKIVQKTVIGNGEFDLKSLLKALTMVKDGNFSVQLPVVWTGIEGKIADTFNEIVDHSDRFANALEDVAQQVGKEGRTGQRIMIELRNGAWATKVSSVNSLISDLVGPVAETTRVIGAVAKGDLSQNVLLEVEGRALQGEFLRNAKTVNLMVEQLGAFASEVTRVAKEVGTDGKLGGQAKLKDVSGTWKELTDSVNLMASNLTSQVRNIAEVTIAVANGDLSKKIMVDVRGEILQLKDTMNSMVEQLRSFASEVTRVAREVGTEGKLGGQAVVSGVAGTWKDLTDSVNQMAGNISSQVRNIADVTTAVAKGDLTRKITVDAKGEILELKNTINIMVDLLNSFASEVTRVAKEVGTEGKLGGQADVKGVSGTWKDLTDNVNLLAGNLTGQVRNIADVTTAVAKGDLTRKITVDAKGEILNLKSTVNTMVDQLNSFASEVARVSKEVGTEGKLGGQADVKGVGGTWKDLTENVNSMASNLTGQVRNIADVTTAVAKGDLTRKITVDAKGEILELKNTINTMVDQLNSFASEVTRVAREVGTEGKLGGQAAVKGVAGIWKDLTDNVNVMAINLTDQVRGIAKVVTAVAKGDLRQKLTVETKGEVAALAETINSMIDTLDTFADQVTTVAREVGVEGKLGGQANVPGTTGTWKDLTDNVNQLAENLTTQVRALAEVATAVTKGDLSRTIQVEARGEVEGLKNNMNDMIRNLKETTDRNMEQDWLKTNLAKFTGMLQGQRDLVAVSKMLLSEISPLIGALHAVFYIIETANTEGKPQLQLLASYAYKERKNVANHFDLGEGLVGQCALEKERILLTNAPSDYIQINSGLGESSPVNIVVLPILFESQVKAVIELASFNKYSATHLSFLEQLTESIGIVINTIEANMKTEALLKQSQTMGQELQNQQEELQQTNEELEEKAKLLGEQKVQVEKKNKEVEQARQTIEEKAKQLAITSKYKSEFLANMSHELRTPLNSLLILSQQLAENPEKNLNEKQTDFAKTIYSSGSDLLNLINDILDLSKIESGTVTLDLSEVRFNELHGDTNRVFLHVAENKKIKFSIDLSPDLPSTITTDSKRLQQVIKNLLSNSFKFTEKGSVSLKIHPVTEGWNPEHAGLNDAKDVIAFEVKDTGIGIAPEKQKIIFEAFQQADGSTNRKYGGTGLGLAISREIAQLLGGEIKLTSEAGHGSTFILYLPLTYSEQEDKNVLSKETQQPIITSLLKSSKKSTEALEPISEISSAGIIISDDRDSITNGDKTVLIVEDDPVFVKIIQNMARESGFKTIIAMTGKAAMELAVLYKPSSITLDIILPDINGWAVLNQLKMNTGTRHIPVHVITVEDSRLLALNHGAIAYLNKPVSSEALKGTFEQMTEFNEHKVKNLLVVEDDENDRDAIVKLIGNGDVHITTAATGELALEKLKKDRFDCIVLDLILPGMSGFELIENIQKETGLANIPIIVNSAKDLSKEETARLNQLARAVVVKSAQSPERLLDETALFLHRVAMNLPEEKRKMIEKLYNTDTSLQGKKVLVVDDDVRNIFAMVSVLERHGMEVLTAENGMLALDVLDKNPDAAIVLMDIMMPDMDGYETMRRIKAKEGFKSLPIIALTAKAMKGDRDKCIEAGASDYISKPVDTNQLLSLIRVWLYTR